MSEAVEVKTREEVELEKKNQYAAKSKIFRENCFSLKVTDDNEYEVAAELMQVASKEVKAINEFMDPEIKTAHKLHRALTAKKNAIIDPLTEGKKFLSGVMGAYSDEVERKQKEEAAELAREAREKDEKARAAEMKRRDEEAKSHEDSGDKATAEMIRNQPAPQVSHSAPISIIRKPKVANISHTSFWKVEVVCKELVPDIYKEIKQGLLDSQATKFKGEIKISGCVIRKGTRTNSRT